MPVLNKRIATVAILMVGGLGLGACASTDYVDERITTVNDRVGALEAKVQEVNGTATGAATAAQNADAAAASANQRIDELTARVDGLEQKLAKKKAPRN